MSEALELPCERCDGSGEIVCCKCCQMCDCPDCEGSGTIECDISDWKVLEKHEKREELLALQDDALRCYSHHAKLVKLNPRAKESYDSQLAETIKKLNLQAKELLK